MWPFTTKADPPIVTEPSNAPTEVAVGASVNLEKLNADLVREYVRSIYLWRSVDMIGSMAASVPLVVAKEHEESQLTPSDSAVEKLLHLPNPQWTGAALQYFVAASIAVANKAFIHTVRGNARIPLELWPLNPNEVTVNYRENSRMVKNFVVQSGMKQNTYEVDGKTGESDIIFIRRPWLSPQTDRSPASVAAAPAEVFTRVLQRCADIVSNSSNITGLLSTESEIAKTAVQEIKDRISQFKTGREASGGTLVTANAKWNLTRLSEDPSSAMSVSLKDSLARDITMTFGVPSQLVGLPGTDTYNNIQLARVGFLTDTILPGYITLYMAALNQAFMKNGARIRADIEHIPAMLQARAQLTESAVKATMLSINEQRALMGYPAAPFDDADMPIKLLELRIKQLAIEAQGGNVANLLEKVPT